MKTSTKKAADLIINMNTLPPQIDYISPKEKADKRDAEELIDNLPEAEKKEALDYIEEQTDNYYAEDESGISPAYLDSLF